MKKVQNYLEIEYFEALKIELEKREQDNKEAKAKAEAEAVDLKSVNLIKKLKIIFLFLKEIALNLLEKMKIRHRLLVFAIKSNTKNFLLFCKKLLQIILRKLKIIL